MSFWDYVAASTLGFLAGGSGVALVVYLARELLGHWLAKQLKEHGAAIDTEEHRKRVSFEALHSRRVAVAEDISRTVADAMMLITHPPKLDGAGTIVTGQESYESRYFGHWKALREYGDETVKTAVHSASLFDSLDLVQTTLVWATQLIGRADPYHDAIVRVTDEPPHWGLPDAHRIARLESARKETLMGPAEKLAAATQALTNHLRTVMRG
jgi:hypothetical protein